MGKCPDAKHNYLKFDDASVVCTKCGDQRIVDVAKLIAQLPQPIHWPCPLPHYPQPPVYPTWWYPNTTHPTISISTGSTMSPDLGDIIVIS